MSQIYLNINSNYPQSSTGKERDSETGFSYFGARYYDSDILTAWLSVDPMADKYPNISPYAYCAWNPIGLIDTNGMEYGGWDKVKRYVGGGLNILGGAVTFAGGVVIGAGGSILTGGAAFPVGALIATTGAYEITQGVRKIMNVATGTPESQDPKFTTPAGEITNSKTVDLVTSVAVGYGPSVVGKISKSVKSIEATKKEVVTKRIEDAVTTTDAIFSSYSSFQSSSNEKQQNTKKNISTPQNKTSNNQANYMSQPIPFL